MRCPGPQLARAGPRPAPRNGKGASVRGWSPPLARRRTCSKPAFRVRIRTPAAGTAATPVAGTAATPGDKPILVVDVSYFELLYLAGEGHCDGALVS